jgi:N-acetylmuramoyl-L-alanine amidase
MIARYTINRGLRLLRHLSPWFGLALILLALSLARPLILSPVGPGPEPSRIIPGNFSAVVLDPGHGGIDDGASANHLKEKNLTLDLGQRISAQLKKAGLLVLLTRNSDQYVSLPDRVNFARALPDSIFVSLHVNFSGKSDARGFEIYRAVSKDDPRLVRVAFSDGDERLDQAEDQLIDCLARAVGADPRIAYRGAKQANFYVVRNLACPAVLIECGFVSNPDDAFHLSDPTYREHLAEQIASGILAYRSVVRGNALQTVVNTNVHSHG